MNNANPPWRDVLWSGWLRRHSTDSASMTKHALWGATRRPHKPRLCGFASATTARYTQKAERASHLYCVDRCLATQTVGMSTREAERRSAAAETLDSTSSPYILYISQSAKLLQLAHLALHDISQLLNTGLDKETLATCVNLIEGGVNPEALAVRSSPCNGSGRLSVLRLTTITA